VSPCDTSVAAKEFLMTGGLPRGFVPLSATVEHEVITTERVRINKTLQKESISLSSSL
jgi:hypothetical protein